VGENFCYLLETEVWRKDVGFFENGKPLAGYRILRNAYKECGIHVIFGS